MADETRIGGGGYGPAEGLPHEPDQSQLPEESGLSQAEESEAGSQAAKAQGQPGGPESADQPEEKPAAASTSGAPVHAHPQQPRDDRRRLGPTTTAPRKPVAGTGSKDEKRADGIDHLDEVPDEVQAGEFRDPEKADSRESNSGQEGDSRLAASAEEQTAAPSPKATDKGASGAGKSSSPANTTSTASVPSGSPGSIAKTSGLDREAVKTTPVATQQTPGQAGSSASPVTGKAQASGRPTPDRLKLTPDGASSSLIRAKVSATKNGGNPRASLGQPLGSPASPRPASPISLRRLPTGEVVSGQKRAVIGSSPAEGSLVADSQKRSAEGASSQLIRSRLAGNRQAAVGLTQSSGNVTAKLSDEQMRELQDRLRRRGATVS
jgi:hypothetical protein